MPHYCLPQVISLSQIQRFIPKQWKHPKYQNKTQSLLHNANKKPSVQPSRELMVECLLTALKDFARQGCLSEAFRTFNLIRSGTSLLLSYDVFLDSLSSLLLSCSKLKSSRQGKQVHAQIIVSGLGQNRILVPKLVSFYASFDFLDDAHYVTEDSNILHPLPWNVLISSYVRNGFCEDAISAYKQMVEKGIRPDDFTFPSVLKACGEQLNLDFGKQVHQHISASSHEQNIFVGNALVSMYGKCGEVALARMVFDKMRVKDEVTWNAMISGYASQGMWTEALHLFESMQVSGVEVNIIVWNTIAGGCLKTGNYKGALQLLSKMRTSKVELDPVAVITGLGASSHIGALKLGKEIHGLAVRKHHDAFNNVKNALITMYARCNDLVHAYLLFKLVKAKSIITWNSIISGYTYWDQSEEASLLFREMLLSGIEPNYVTIASILPLCARVANLQHGREFHCYITRREGFEEYLLLWNALVDMYARSGKVLVAKRLFDLLGRKDVVTYTTLIAGYGIQGEGRAAIELFDEMLRSCIKPDHVTMIAVLSACSHSGLVAKGQAIFENMQSVYGITPSLQHYACMADLFGRAGLLRNAERTIRRMPYKPTPEMWATLIGACRIHGNMEIGELAAEKLLEMKPENSGYYVLIANMYAAAGCWNKLAKVRTFMRDLGVKKSPGSAWVDGGAGFTPFLVADTSNSQTDEIYCLVGELTEQMKNASDSDSCDSGLEEVIAM